MQLSLSSKAYVVFAFCVLSTAEDSSSCPVLEVDSNASPLLMTQVSDRSEKAQPTFSSSRTIEHTRKKQFSGLQVGFLNGRKQRGKKKTRASRPDITAKDQSSARGSLVLKDVQEPLGPELSELSAQSLWKKLQTRPDLIEKLNDPKLIGVFAEISCDPVAALNKYAKDSAVATSVGKLAEFLCGDLLVKAPEQQQKQQRADSDVCSPEGEVLMKECPAKEDTLDFQGRKVPRKQVDRWMSNPAIMAVLADPNTSVLLNEMRTDPTRHANNPKIRALRAAGIIAA